MAAITPSNLYIESAGSMTCHLATFAIGSSPGDTWTTSIPNIVFACAQGVGSATGANVTAAFVQSTSIITFGGGVSVTHPAFNCMILSK